MLATQRPPRAVDGRRPVHRLLRHIGGGQDFGAYGSQEDATAGHIALPNRVPPIGGGLYCLHLIVENQICRDPICREKCQQSPHDDSLQYICDDGSPEHDGEHPFACIS